MRQGVFFRVARITLFGLLLWSHSSPSHSADWLYTFRAGDTLWDICKQYTKHTLCWRELGPYNGIDLDRRIAPGTRIRIPANWLKVPAASAELRFVSGYVDVTLLGETTKAAEAGMKLPIGAQVTTSAGSATVTFADGSSITLAPQTQLVLDTLSSFDTHGMVDSTIRLNRGTIKTRVLKRTPRSQFKTITPSAVASVRGTEYRIHAGAQEKEPNASGNIQGETLISVFEGLIEVGALNTNYDVPAEFGIVAKEGEAPTPPVKLLDAPLLEPLETQQYVTLNTKGMPEPPLTLNWQAVNEASAYQLNVFADALQPDAPERLLLEQGTKTTTANIALPEGCYLLALRAIDKPGLHGLAAKKRLCLNKKLPAPQLLEPPPPVDGATSVNITWPAVDSATAYHVELAEHADFSTLLSEFTTTETTASLSHDKTVYVRIKAKAEDGNTSEFSKPISWQPPPPNDTDWTILIPAGLYLLGLVLI